MNVEAYQYKVADGFANWPKWLQEAWEAGKKDTHALGVVVPSSGAADSRLQVNTTESAQSVKEGDYFVKEGDMDIRAMSQKDFEAEFEEVKPPAKKAQNSTKEDSGSES